MTWLQISLELGLLFGELGLLFGVLYALIGFVIGYARATQPT